MAIWIELPAPKQRRRDYGLQATEGGSVEDELPPIGIEHIQHDRQPETGTFATLIEPSASSSTLARAMGAIPGPPSSTAIETRMLANVVVGLVVVHILGVLVASVQHRENLVRSMMTGRKPVR